MKNELSELTDAIAAAQPSMTKLESRIASYILARPEILLIETNAEIARRLGVSPMTVTRFYRKLGFEGAFSARAAARLKAFGPEARRIDQRFASAEALRQSTDRHADVESGHAAIDAAFSLRDSVGWQAVVDLTAHADSIHAIGFQTMHYLADGLCRRLSYLRDRVHILDGIDGVYAGLLPSSGERITLIIIDSFRYGAHGPLLARLASERGVDVVVFADEFCEWAGAITPHVLRYPAETRFVLSLPVGISIGLTLLLQDVAATLGDAARQRIEKLSDAQDHFGLFLE